MNQVENFITLCEKKTVNKQLIISNNVKFDI